MALIVSNSGGEIVRNHRRGKTQISAKNNRLQSSYNIAWSFSYIKFHICIQNSTVGSFHRNKVAKESCGQIYRRNGEACVHFFTYLHHSKCFFFFLVEKRRLCIDRLYKIVFHISKFTVVWARRDVCGDSKREWKKIAENKILSTSSTTTKTKATYNLFNEKRWRKNDYFVFASSQFFFSTATVWI